MGPNVFDDIGGEYVNRITTLLKTKNNLSIQDVYNYIKSGITKFEEEEMWNYTIIYRVSIMFVDVYFPVL